MSTIKTIVKTKFLCKSGCKTAPSRGYSGKQKLNWTDLFVEGKWYDGEYETWSWEDGYRINGGWRKYWVVNEKGEKEKIPKAHMKVIFEFDIQQLREEKLKDILN